MVFSGPQAPCPDTDLLSWFFGPDCKDNTSRAEPDCLDSDTPLLTNVTRGEDGILHTKHLTFGETRVLIKQLAAGLQKIGCANGKRVVVMSQDRMYYWPLFFACIAAGAIFVGSHPDYTVDDVAYFLRESGASVFVTGVEFQDRAEEAVTRSQIDMPIYVLDDNVSELKDSATSRIMHWSRLIEPSGSKNLKWRQLTTSQRKSEPAVFIFSSGSTGKRKAAQLSQYSLMCGAAAYLKSEIKPQKLNFKSLCRFPPGHSLIINLTLGALKSRAEVVIPVNVDISHIGQVVEELEVNILAMKPAFVVEFSKTCNITSGFPSIDSILTGGDVVPVPVLDTIDQLCGCRDVIKILYGSSEAGGTTAIAVGRLSDRKQTGGLCIGRLQPNANIRLTDPETKEELGRNQVGELWLETRSKFLGYWEDDEATKRVLVPEGYVRIGDLARVDDQGRWWFVRRLKDVISVLGTLINPADIEYWIGAEVQGVEELAIVPRSLPNGTEEPKAFIVKEQNSEVSADCIHDVVNHRLNPFHALTGGINFVPSLPKSAAGKIDKLCLRKMAQEEAIAAGQ